MVLVNVNTHPAWNLTAPRLITLLFSLSCTHTSRQSKQAWWELTFSTEVQVDWINVWNRKNFADRIDQARVSIVGLKPQNQSDTSLKFVEGVERIFLIRLV